MLRQGPVRVKLLAIGYPVPPEEGRQNEDFSYPAASNDWPPQPCCIKQTPACSIFDAISLSVPASRLPPLHLHSRWTQWQNFPASGQGPPCPSRSLVAVNPPRYQRSTATLQHQKPLHHFVSFFFLELFHLQQRLYCAVSIARWALQDEAPLQLPTIAASPPASDRPPGLPSPRAPLVLIQLPALLSSRTPSAGNLGAAGWSHALAAVLDTGDKIWSTCAAALFTCFVLLLRHCNAILLLACWLLAPAADVTPIPHDSIF